MPDSLNRIVVGTASLGAVYGLPRKTGAELPLMPEQEACAILSAALSAGLKTFDTAPVYGEAEKRLGIAVGPGGVIWTKVAAPPRALDITTHLDSSINQSLVRLRRPALDGLSWHNWTRESFSSPEYPEAWSRLRSDRRVGTLGATTYGADDALAAVRSGFFEMVQIEWNLLNQSVMMAVGDEARRRGVRICARSVLLKGVLTDEGRALPNIPALREGVARVAQLAADNKVSVTVLALRAALEEPGIDSVVLGIDSGAQLAETLACARLPRFGTDISSLHLQDREATDPRYWEMKASVD